MTSKTTLRKWPIILNIVGCTQFIIITLIAMIFYEGGTYIDPTSTHYLFCYNYFSDLGRTVAHSGISNTISFILFTISLSVWGGFQIPFYVIFPQFFKDSKELKKYYLSGSTLGVFAGVFYIGIALTPSDITNLLHDLFVFFGFGSIFLSVILYAIVIFKDRNYDDFYAKIFTITAGILCLYFILLTLTPDSQTKIGLFIFVIGQKVMIYTLLICGIIQGLGALKHLNT